MGVPQIPSVDSDTKQFPDALRARIAGNLRDTTTPEGAVLVTRLLSSSNGAAQTAINQGATVALTGHSLMYGQDTTSGTTLPAANGATQTRSTTPPPEQFAAQSALIAGTAPTIVNQGYPGDRSSDSLQRWTNGTSGALEIFWLDTNDGNDYGNNGGTLSDAQTLANFRALVDRAKSRGADVVVIGGAPTNTTTASRKVFASAQSDRAAAERLGAKYVDVGDILAALPKSITYQTDGVHLTPRAYTLVAARLAALTGPKGVNPPRVAPGRTITPREMVHQGGAVVARAGAADGNVWQIASGSNLAIPVDVTAPCIAVIRFRQEGTTIGNGIAGLYYNLSPAAGLNTRYVEVQPVNSAGDYGFTYATNWAMTSPGPDSIIVKAESGTIEVDSITFIPVSGRMLAVGDVTEIRRQFRADLAPVGGTGSSVDGCVDTAVSVSLRAGSTQTKVSRKWVFDAALTPNAGVVLANSVMPTGAFVRRGHIVARSGTSLVVKSVYGTAAGETVSVTVPNVFASATGVTRSIITIVHNTSTTKLDVYVDGTLQTSVDATIRFLTPGLIAPSANEYASANCSVYLTDVGDGM